MEANTIRPNIIMARRVWLARAAIITAILVVPNNIEAFVHIRRKCTIKAHPCLHDHSKRVTSLKPRGRIYFPLLVRNAAEKRDAHDEVLKRILYKPKRRLVKSTILAFVTIFVCCRSRVAVGANQVGGSLLPTPLGLRQVASASALVAVIGGLGLTSLGLKDLARQLMIACARCTLQLQLLGGLILQWLLAPSSQQPWWIISAWIVGVGLLGAQEAYGRLEYSYPHLRQHLTLSFLVGGLSVLTIAVHARFFGYLYPWYQPQTLIPVAGMLFGNCLSAVTLGASALTRAFAAQQDQVGLWLARGATYQEAIFSLVRESVTAALTPTITALSVTGIVHIPGMMTGQVYAGRKRVSSCLSIM